MPEESRLEGEIRETKKLQMAETPEEKKNSGSPASSRSERSAKIPGQGKQKDVATYLVFRDNKNFADVYNHTVFVNAPISAEDLTMDDGRETALLKVTKKAHTALTQYRDLKKELGKEQSLVILGIENQSRQSYQMPFRVLEVDFLNYARQIREITDRNKQYMKMKKSGKNAVAVHNLSKADVISEEAEDIIYIQPEADEYLDRFYKFDRIRPCITLVIYWGTTPWEGPRSLSEMFEESPWAAYASDYKMHLLEVHQIPDEELATYNADLRALLGFVKYSKDKKHLQNYIKENQKIFSDVSGTVLDAIEEMTHSEEIEKLKQKAAVSTEERGNCNMCQALKEWMEDERNEGRAEGRAEEMLKTAKERERADQQQARADQQQARADAAEEELHLLKLRFGLI